MNFVDSLGNSEPIFMTICTHYCLSFRKLDHLTCNEILRHRPSLRVDKRAIFICIFYMLNILTLNYRIFVNEIFWVIAASLDSRACNIL